MIIEEKTACMSITQKEFGIAFLANWKANAKEWLDAGHSREQVAIWLMQHLGPKVAKEVLKSV